MQGRRPRALSGGTPPLRGPRVRRGLPIGTRRPCCRVVAPPATNGLPRTRFRREARAGIPSEEEGADIGVRVCVATRESLWVAALVVSPPRRIEPLATT